jgi:hypothetical protein
MRYIIDRKTKEHERYDGQNYDATKYRIVEADSEGWIKHEGRECPLPEDVRCEVKFADGGAGGNLKAGRYGWTGEPEYANISHYRPILAEPEKEQEPEPIPAQLTTNTLDLLDRLKSAHKAAQSIPDLESELREVLGSMGYTLGKLSPFVEPEAQGTDAAVKDALIYGTSVMRGGKYTPIQDFYVAPEAAKENNDEL